MRLIPLIALIALATACPVAPVPGGSGDRGPTADAGNAPNDGGVAGDDAGTAPTTDAGSSEDAGEQPSHELIGTWRADPGEEEVLGLAFREDGRIDRTQVTSRDAARFLANLAVQTNRYGETVQPSTCANARSGLRHFMIREEDGQTGRLPDNWDGDLAPLTQGIMRVAAQRKKESINPQDWTLGQEHLPFEMYRTISLRFLYRPSHVGPGKDGTDFWGHCYHTLMWNLMCRSNSAETLMLNRINWAGDCLSVDLGSLKNAQSNAVLKDPLHVYANPKQPEICPVLGLGLHLLMRPPPGSGSEEGRLFPNQKQGLRFGDRLRKVLNGDEGKALMTEHGRTEGRITSHSYRKGSSSYVTTGSTNGPSIYSVYVLCF